MNDNTNFITSLYSLLTATNTPNLGELLNTKCETLGISQRKLSEILNIERKSLQRILEGEAQKIDVIMFLKISQFLELEINELLQIYVAKLDPSNIKEIETARRASFILQNFNLDSLKKIKFIKDKNDYEDIEQRIKKFLGLSSIFEYKNLFKIAFMSRTRREFSDKMLKFWISGIYYQIKNIHNPNPYDRKLLLNIIPKLRGLTRDENNGLFRVSQALYEAGITVIFQTYIEGIQIRGATFVSDKKPYIVITDFKKDYATVWFALCHELYHTLKDFDQIERLSYHLTGQSDLFIDQLTEANANEFARQLLFPDDRMNYIQKFIDIPAVVEQFAEQNNVHPAIIYSFYLYDNNSDKVHQGELQAKFKKYVPKAEYALRNLLVNPWIKEDITEITKEINSLYNIIQQE